MILQGNSSTLLKDINDNSIDLLLTDPPYGIEFMGKDWDKAVVSVDIWKECYRTLKQGKLAFIMCSPRQDVLSRMIVNLQDAGFRTNYTSIYWTYASGFPKAANVSKLIDKRNGATREIIGKRTDDRYGRNFTESAGESTYQGYNPKTIGLITKPATEEAKKMEGAYVGFQPKPAVEVILVVSKGKTLTWLDDCRTPHDEPIALTNRNERSSETWRDGSGFRNEQNNIRSANEKGRFPANLLVSDDILNDGKIRPKSGRPNSIGKIYEAKRNVYGDYNNEKFDSNYNDSGSYSRYFDLDKWYSTLPFIITPKASKSEKNKGCEDLPEQFAPKGNNIGRDMDNPRNHLGGMQSTKATNFHPTVKPIKLMSYLITMGSREGDLVLDPFCGSGTTLLAAHQLHRKYLGIELNPEYIKLAKERLNPLQSQLKIEVWE